ncbi:redoxin domain-containing protein [Alkalibacillus almallahensis]|uniref:redoxin domain-containing protein n=1 Tax=Alkalibacillus almallahensis TaxID=1379154 RepID=UPI0014234C64|nr:redoxin domain-containing protein [Alkalibacillus almallahensis]NIK11421.1 peroxiredoxin [Alkalibacillus almallahensis]
MKRIILIVAILAMFGWAVYDFVIEDETTNEESSNSSESEDYMVSGEADGGNPEELETGLEIGSQAPNFELETLDGSVVRLSDFRGQRVMINFWATWCPPCRAEMPDMQKFHENTDIKILAVNLTESENSISDVSDFTEEFGLSFPILLDREDQVATAYEIIPIPSTYMVDSEGIIQHKAFGAMNYDMMVQEYEKMD